MTTNKRLTFHWNFFQILSDGSVGARTAALSLPYVGTENEYGTLWYTQVSHCDKYREV